jgi:hypothetical protein
MSSFTAIADIGETLKKMLEDDPWTGISPRPEITLKSPKELQEGQEEGGNPNKVSLFLFRILENEHLKNEELQRVDNTTLRFPPFSMDLEYLVTPYSDDKTQEKIILGKVLEIFQDNTILKGTLLQGNLAGSDEEIKLLFNPISLDDMTKMWSSFQDVGYRLSASYLVTPVRIDSIRAVNVQRVASKEMDHSYMKPTEKGE